MTRLTVDTPFGKFHLLENQRQLWVACFDANLERFELLFEEATESADSPTLIRAERELEEYFAGRRFEFSFNFGLNHEDCEMGTAFQKQAWRKLQDIPYGQTISYKEQALWMGHPKAVRAIGRANSKNPLSIFVPCHRVIGSQGDLTGYAGGLGTKRKLLELEQTYKSARLLFCAAVSQTVC
jgi:methylated-DNA-[protein]-cysteine S-methyltransferase